MLRGATASLVSLSAGSRAQSPGKPWRIAYFSFRRGPNEFEQAFQRGLRERGLIEGNNLIVDYRWAGFDPDRHRANVTEALTLQPALVMIVDGSGTRGGLDVVEMPVALPDRIETAFAAAVRQGVQCVAIVSDTGTIDFRSPLCDRSLAHRLPTIFANRTYLRAGGLLSYGPDLEGAFQRSAYFVERILKGAKAAELPIEQTTAFHLTLNLRTARALDLRFPKSLLTRADDVIE